MLLSLDRENLSKYRARKDEKRVNGLQEVVALIHSNYSSSKGQSTKKEVAPGGEIRLHDLKIVT